jgi:hypothetical protein
MPNGSERATVVTVGVAPAIAGSTLDIAAMAIMSV